MEELDTMIFLLKMMLVFAGLIILAIMVAMVGISTRLETIAVRLGLVYFALGGEQPPTQLTASGPPPAGD